MKINFTEVKPLFYWVQHILPLVYDDSLSYMELLGRVTKRLNELIENNNNLPDYIMELIKEYISSGEIEKVLAEVLANYMLNVKFPPAGLTPAKGDGSAEDTEAIQGCIDYAFNNGGMSVYFPSGSYLTHPLTLRNKSTLFGQDRYTTRLIMKGGATTAMFTGDVDELTLTGLGFDGNMDIQVNNVNLFDISVNSAIISNCLLTDGYELLNITVNNDLQLNNLLFRHAVENALVLNGAGIVQGENLIFKSVSTLVGKNFVVMGVSKSILEQVKCYGASPNGVLINGNNNVVKMWNEQSLTPFVDNGANNSVTVYTQSEIEKLTGSKTKIIGGNATETITGSSTESVAGNKEVSAQNYNETVRGNKTTTASNSTENITNDKELNANVSRETLVTKTVNVINVNTENSGSKNETIEGNKTVDAGNISNTAENITIHTTQDLTEQVDGDRNLTVTGANNETTGARTETVNGKKTENYIELDVLATNGESHSGKQMAILTDEPLKYGEPTSEPYKSIFFNYLKMQDKDNNIYNLLAENENTSLLIKTNVNVLEYGFKNDGVSDNVQALENIYSLFGENINFIFPSGNYLFNSSISLKSGCSFIGLGLVNSKLICKDGIIMSGVYTSIKNIHIDFKASVISINCNSSFSIFENLWLENGVTSLKITSNNVNINNCFINSSVIGIELNTGAININISNSFIFSSSTGLVINQIENRVEGIQLINTIIALCETCVTINGGVLLLNFTNCILDQYNKYGIIIQDIRNNVDGITLNSCYIGSKISDFNSIALIVSSLTKNITLNACYIATNKFAGVFITEDGRNSENVKIVNCTFRDNSTDLHIDTCISNIIALNTFLSQTSIVVLNESTGIVMANKYVNKSIVDSVTDQFNFTN